MPSEKGLRTFLHKTHHWFSNMPFLGMLLLLAYSSRAGTGRKRHVVRGCPTPVPSDFPLFLIEFIVVVGFGLGLGISRIMFLAHTSSDQSSSKAWEGQLGRRDTIC